MEQDEIEIGMVYPSSEGQGVEPLVIPREPGPGGCDAGFDAVQLREMPNMIRERIVWSAQYGNLNSTLSHYEKVLDEFPSVFDERMLTQAKALLAEGKKVAGDKEGKQAFLKKTQSFFNSLRMKKI